MNKNYIGLNQTALLPGILADMLQADEIASRAGLTKELTHVGITMTQPWQREMLCPNRKPSIAAQIAETMWVLAGRDDVEWLKNYLPRAEDFSDDGKTWRAAYGPRLRAWKVNEDGDVIDQVARVIEVLQESPASRQAVISIWDPALDNVKSKDIPCNNWLSFSSRLGKLDLHVAVRSNDAIWGWSGINVFEWSALQEIIAGILGLEVGGLHFSTTSFHLYDRHFAKAQLIASHDDNSYLDQRLEDSPRFTPSETFRSLDMVDLLIRDWFNIEKYIRFGEDMSRQVNDFPEPMMRSWLRVLQWWWTGQEGYLEPLAGTRLWAATKRSVQPPKRGEEPTVDEHPPVTAYAPEPTIGETLNMGFVQWVSELHEAKHAAYGDSWKKRGESFSIIPNIGRKIDRLNLGGSTEDESQTDTAVDLMVYLAKYRCWLVDNRDLNSAITREVLSSYAVPYSGETAAPNALISWCATAYGTQSMRAFAGNRHQLTLILVADFERLVELVERNDDSRADVVDRMLDHAYMLASSLWAADLHRV